jgi:hypothetical protein
MTPGVGRAKGYGLSRSATTEEIRERVLRDLEEMGAWFEWYSPGRTGSRLYAVDVPPDADWEDVYRYLTEAEEKGQLGWQSSWRGSSPGDA